jgi:hypothetical protein
LSGWQAEDGSANLKQAEKAGSFAEFWNWLNCRCNHAVERKKAEENSENVLR